MKRIQVLFLISFILVIGACKKVEETSAKVSVFDLYSGSFVPNYKVTLFERFNDKPTLSIGSGNNHYNSYALKSGVTDVNGNFDFGAFEAMKSNKYDYFINEQGIGKGVDNNVQLKIRGWAWLSVLFLPSPPYNTGDSLVVSFEHYIFQSQKFKITQSNYSIQSLPRSIPDGRYYVNIDKFKSGIYANIKDTILLLYHTTTNYDVNW